MKTRKKMSQSCKLCSMPMCQSRNQTNRPLKLCQKILKNCKEYLDENDLVEIFANLDCKREPLPFCSRCFVTTEKLSELNDKLEEIRAEILDLVESFKLEFLKSREIVSIYNSTKTKNKGNNSLVENTNEVVEIKEETISDDSCPDSPDPESLKGNYGLINPILVKIQNSSIEGIQTLECAPDLTELDGREYTQNKSRKRKSSDADDSSDLLSDDEKSNVEEQEDSTKKWDSSDSAEEESLFAKPKKRKKRYKRKKRECEELYQKPNFIMRPEIAENFIYKGHVVDSQMLVLTCKYCRQDKRGGKTGDLGNFRRHLKIKHADKIDVSAPEFQPKGTRNRKSHQKDDEDVH